MIINTFISWDRGTNPLGVYIRIMLLNSLVTNTNNIMHLKWYKLYIHFKIRIYS